MESTMTSRPSSVPFKVIALVALLLIGFLLASCGGSGGGGGGQSSQIYPRGITDPGGASYAARELIVVLPFDVVHDEIYVANYQDHSITVYARSADGNTAPHPRAG
jgi:hypothetical protein